MDVGVVCTGGLGPEKELVASLLSRTEDPDRIFVVAADSGLLLCREYGLTPHLFVGDLDSLPDRSVLHAFPRTEVRIFPRDKDYTDTELAIEALRERGVHRWFLLGGGGGRADQFLGIVSLCIRDFHPEVWLTHREEIRVLREGCRYRIDVQRGDIISLFPLSCRRCRAVTRGLRWPLDSLEWRPGDMGISNEAVEDVVEVMVVEGRYLWVRNLAPV
ncbi:thiamine pyrophosphokinase [Spirochaeta thermophila DSM 6578]|uniref:Thiamine diphosphokinase n=1 Tax=Winmispira thermophila (strain ATCC 700085 / DSM 6578 / Z-1203) TaxID=869211 RepID=G0GDM3_WINT7|nr:thiamine diphosphokinase [Spirochaeta thermophila]AEJ61370.1 thiamine pyrophosphokinase [Spirochaeta thermophila DSM 6578]